MATLVNKKNREVKVIIPNMREFSTFYSDNEGVIGMFFKRDWVEETTKKEEHWKPSEEQMDRLFSIVAALRKDYCDDMADFLASIYHNLKKLM